MRVNPLIDRSPIVVDADDDSNVATLLNVRAVTGTRVSVDTRPYVRNHGAEPRGVGGWAFGVVDPARVDYLKGCIWVYNVTYGAAKREAKRQAAARGVSVLWVLP